MEFTVLHRLAAPLLQVSPLTEFFFWPRKDAWEELRLALEARPWISERDKVCALESVCVCVLCRKEGGEGPYLMRVTGLHVCDRCGFAIF